MKSCVLICDDNIAIHKSLTSYLHAEGIETASAYSGEDALAYLKDNFADIMVLDIMLPGISGLDVCREVRKTNGKIYIIMLSAKGEELDRIVGLELGADDYVAKPFSPRELSIRIRKILARVNSKSSDKELTFAELTIYPDSYRAFINEEHIDLTPKEFGVLSYFVMNAGKVVTREHILDSVWGYEYFGDTRTVDSLVKRLRQKLSGYNVHFAIRSIYGVGYRLEEIR